MAKIKSIFTGLDRKVDDIINKVLLEFANKMLDAIPSELRSSYTLTVEKNRVILWTEDEMAAYIEFGTGDDTTVKNGLSAKSYLSGQPDMVQKEAIQFFKTGKGTIPAEPYLFPAFFKYRDWALLEMDKRIQELFNRL